MADSKYSDKFVVNISRLGVLNNQLADEYTMLRGLISCDDDRKLIDKVVGRIKEIHKKIQGIELLS